MSALHYGEQTEDRLRVRVRYQKGESIKFISHQDEFRAWERALRRAGVPLLYKQGFNPQPHIQFASPLGVGFTGMDEILDITFSPPIPLDELRQRIAGSLPPGLTLNSMEETQLKGPAMQSLLMGADYSLIIYAAQDEFDDEAIKNRIREFLDQTECWRERERKGSVYRYNLRPLILELEYRGYDRYAEQHLIFVRVQQRAGATGRPDEVASVLGLDHFARSLLRERLYFENVPEHRALFSRYPVADKDQIAGASPDKAMRKRKRRGKSPSGQPRSAGERAGDEFD